MATYNSSLVKNHWGTLDCSASEKNFYCFPPLRTRSCQLIFDETDAADRSWCEYWTVEKYLKTRIPFEKCLSICCGFGNIERTLSKLHVAKKIIGTDIAPGAIAEARKRATAENLDNIEYFVADLNKVDLPASEYDLVWANGALHHIADLEGVISKLHRVIQNGGYLISNEYVGPRYQQIPARQQELVNAVKHLLPPELRRKDLCPKPYGNSMFAKAIRFAVRHLIGWFRPGKIYDVLWEKRPIEHFLAYDPSECVKSDQIIPTLNKYFPEVEVKYYNGSILQHALDMEFYTHYDSTNPKHRTILQMLFNIESSLATAGEISQDNAHIICKKY